MTEYLVAPVASKRGLCSTCGCKLQTPGYYDGTPESGSIWLTPWHDCGGHCTVCMAHAGDPDAFAALEHWLAISRPKSPPLPPPSIPHDYGERGIGGGTATVTRLPSREEFNYFAKSSALTEQALAFARKYLAKGKSIVKGRV